MAIAPKKLVCTLEVPNKYPLLKHSEMYSSEANTYLMTMTYS